MMNMTNVLYHKTKVLALDDSRAYLDSLEIALENTFDLITMTDAKQALSLLNDTQENISPLISHVVEDKTVSDQIIEIDKSHLYKMIYNKSRFNYVSVLIVDYQMPGLNGLEFCELIKNDHVQIILLTAIAGESQAIDAFNKGLINRFFSKNDPELNEKLTTAIDELQRAYFSSISKQFSHHFDIDFKDCDYLDVFNQVKSSISFAEYYLLDKFGSALFIDEKGSPTWLIIRDEKEMKDCYLIAKEQGAKKEIIAVLKDRKKLLFQLTEEDMKKSISQWNDYLFEAKRKGKLYYSVIDGKTKNSVAWNKAIFYSKP